MIRIEKDAASRSLFKDTSALSHRPVQPQLLQWNSTHLGPQGNVSGTSGVISVSLFHTGQDKGHPSDSLNRAPNFVLPPLSSISAVAPAFQPVTNLRKATLKEANDLCSMRRKLLAVTSSSVQKLLASVEAAGSAQSPSKGIWQGSPRNEGKSNGAKKRRKKREAAAAAAEAALAVAGGPDGCPQ
jgi:hypothetical protein